MLISLFEILFKVLIKKREFQYSTSPKLIDDRIMNKDNYLDFIDPLWDQSITPALESYIKIPNKSPLFDRNWEANGFMEQAVTLMCQWCEENAVNGMTLEVVRLPHRTPLIFIEIAGASEETILLYGHLDKQPEMTGWSEGLGPWQPVLKDEKLYGRGGADDGYAVFASLSAIAALQRQQIPHARCIIMIEACEESGSFDLPFYIDALEKRIGNPSLVICLDSGCGNFDQLWVTTSLRGLIGGVLTIDVLREGVHSGSGSGIVPSCFRILRQLLNRIEDEETGNIRLNDLIVDIPTDRDQQAQKAASVLSDEFLADLPFVSDAKAESSSISELVLRRTWRAALSVVGCDGIPAIANAGNVTLPTLSAKLSLRLPPTCDAQQAALELKKVLERDPPYQAKILFDILETSNGWNAPIEAIWLKEAANQASQKYFGRDAVYMGEGGSIPFMGMLGKKFPKAQFLITGVLGPGSNAHGPNEFLHISTAKRLTACVAYVIDAHFRALKP